MSKSKDRAPNSVVTDPGATMVEYALVVGGIALVVAFAAQTFGLAVLTLFENILSAF